MDLLTFLKNQKDDVIEIIFEGFIEKKFCKFDLRES